MNDETLKIYRDAGFLVLDKLDMVVSDTANASKLLGALRSEIVENCAKIAEQSPKLTAYAHGMPVQDYIALQIRTTLKETK
jgi:hypothetical protein